MNTQIIKALLSAVLVGIMLVPAVVHAHGDLIHVIGVVDKVSDTAVTVKTREGKTVEVQFGEKTTYQRAKAAVDKAAIKLGDRIVIHAAKVNDKLVAHTVELGAASVAQKGTK